MEKNKTKTLAEQLAEENKAVTFATGKDNPQNIKGLVTQAQVDKWKAAHPDGIYGVISKGHVAYFRYPTRDEINDALQNMVEGDPYSPYRTMAEMAFIGGAVEILTSDRLYATAIHKIKEELDGDAEIINF